MDDIDHMFDFSAFDNDNQETNFLSDNHSLNDGDGFNSQDPFSLFMEEHAFADLDPIEPTRLSPFENHAGMPLPSDPQYYDGMAESFPVVNMNMDAAGIAQQLGQPTPQPVEQQIRNDEVSLVFDATLPAVPVLTTPNVASPAFDHTATYPQIMPVFRPLTPVLNVNQEQRWQFTAYQQPQLFQPQARPPFVQLQQMQVVQDQVDLTLQSPFQSPSDELSQRNLESPPELHPTPDYHSEQAVSQVHSSSQTQSVSPEQEVLSVEQIQMLQNAEPAEHGQPDRRNTSYQNVRRVNLPPDDSSSSSAGEDEAPKKAHRSRKINSKRTTRTVSRPPSSEAEVQHHLPQALIPGLTFASLGDAEQAMATRIIESDWTPPHPDNTIPTTQLQRSEYVLMMYKAMQDTTECKDNPSGFSFLKRWDDTDYYNLQEMEKVCWHMLDIAERLHNQGPTASNMYCEDALKKLKASRLLTFEQRIRAVCDMLRFSKNLCDNLMKGEGLEALIGAPKQKMSGAKTMVAQNLRRQKWIVHGRTEEQSKVGVLDQDESSERPTRKGENRLKKSGAAAKTRTKKKPTVAAVSDDDSDGVEENDGLERRQSEFTFRRRSTQESSDTDEPPAKVARRPLKPDSSKSSSTLSKPSATAPRARPQSRTKSTKRASSPQVGIPRTEIDAARARFAEQKEEDAKATAEAKTSAKTKPDRRSRKRTADLGESGSEGEQSRPSKKPRGKAPSRNYVPSPTRKTRAFLRANPGKKSPAVVFEEEQLSESSTDDQELIDTDPKDNINETDYGSEDFEEADEAQQVASASDLDIENVTAEDSEKADVEEEEKTEEQDSELDEIEERNDPEGEVEVEAEVQDETEEDGEAGEESEAEVEEEKVEDNDAESDHSSESKKEAEMSESDKPEPFSPPPPPSPNLKRKIEEETKRGTSYTARLLAMTENWYNRQAKPVDVLQSSKPVTRVPAHIKDTQMKPIKRKRLVQDDSESKSDHETASVKRAKTHYQANRKSVHVAAKQTSVPANNGKIKNGRAIRDARGRFIRHGTSPEPELKADVENESEPEVVPRPARTLAAVRAARRIGFPDSKGRRRGGK